MLRSLLYLTTLASLAALSGWFLWTVQNALESAESPADHGPKLVLERFSSTRINRKGVREYALKAPTMVQLPGAQGTELQQPHLQVFQPNGDTIDWLLDAEQGWVAPNKKLIRLEQAVRLSRPLSSGKLPMVISTRNVLIRPDDNTVETAEHVVMESPKGTMEGVGLTGDLNAEQWHLWAAVRGRYDAPSQ